MSVTLRLQERNFFPPFSHQMGKKRPLASLLQEDAGYFNVYESIKNLKLDGQLDLRRQSSRDSSSCTGSVSGLLPHPNNNSEEDEIYDANYHFINPILREAHYLRRLRLSQRSKEDVTESSFQSASFPNGSHTSFENDQEEKNSLKTDYNERSDRMEE